MTLGVLEIFYTRTFKHKMMIVHTVKCCAITGYDGTTNITYVHIMIFYFSRRHKCFCLSFYLTDCLYFLVNRSTNGINPLVCQMFNCLC